MSEYSVAVLGASGYAGGEFLRIALGHPALRVVQATSRRHAGRPLHAAHPNLRGVSDLRFVDPDDLAQADIVVSALPHGELAQVVDQVASRAGVLLDLSADFRLRDPDAYRRHYGEDHPRPELLGGFVYANPELHRADLAGATRLAAAGCTATAAILALAPAMLAGLLDPERDGIVEVKVGSSAAGSAASAATHHPERSGAVRTYAVTGHRHAAELEQELGSTPRIHWTATAIERIRGVLATCHAFVRPGVTARDVLAAYRERYARERFVRLIVGGSGIHRVPDPKVLDGSNICDVGFQLDEATGRLVALAALDNLVKGTAGHAVQALNLALGLPEETGLAFPGLHP
ncbi:MAG: N-acetyl-gamma-glutamyl-phosphate reductase [Trueperaceae bacterium]|nr:N-acetyl-gamma-glutamyl-phosphate reductase [Trueperaceae bacterium]